MTENKQHSTTIEAQEEADQDAVIVDVEDVKKDETEKEQKISDNKEEFEVPDIEGEQDEDGWVVL